MAYVETDLDCAVRKSKIFFAFAGLVKSRTARRGSLGPCGRGMTGTSRMSPSSQVGLTGLYMLTTSVWAFGVDMLVIVSGK